MEGMNGRQVLGMKRDALETAFGKDEGSRLDSQITLSRYFGLHAAFKKYLRTRFSGCYAPEILGCPAGSSIIIVENCRQCLYRVVVV